MSVARLGCPDCGTTRRVSFDTDGYGHLVERWEPCWKCDGKPLRQYESVKVVEMDPVKFCPQCQTQLTRKLHGATERRESLTNFKARVFCGKPCARKWVGSHRVAVRGPYKKRKKRALERGPRGPYKKRGTLRGQHKGATP